MNIYKVFVARLMVSVLVLMTISTVAFAAPADNPNTGTSSSRATILPNTALSVPNCETLMNEVAKNSCLIQVNLFGKKNTSCDSGANPTISGGAAQNTAVLPSIGAAKANDVLACGIKTGTIHLWMMPYYVRYILEFVIGLSGLAAVGGMIYGGYMYLFAGLSSEKDQGKKAIMYGVIGMILTLVAWALVNIIISFVTS